MSNEIVLTKSVNGVSFGTKRADVRDALGEKFTEFKKNKFSKNTTDDYGDFHVYYTPDDKMEAVEFFKDAEIKVTGKSVPWDFVALKEWLLCIDPAAAIDADGITSAANGINIYAPSETVETILVAEPSYFA